MTLPGPVSPEYLLAWARHTHRSPLYSRLVHLTADRPDLLRVIQRIHNRPPPNVFLAAIHYLLMGDPGAPLARFYPSLHDDPGPVDQVDSDFVDFVLANEDQIVDLANTRYTQTNECRRCTALLPGVMTSPFDTFHLIEIGASAGLNLALDRYRYDFGGLVWGPGGGVLLTADTPGDPPRLRPIELRRRIGIDLDVVDRSDPDDLRWLDALIWPEHEDRRRCLHEALESTGDVEIEMVEGSVIDELAGALERLPGGEPVVVMNSFVLNQLDEEQRAQVSGIVAAAQRGRPVYRVSLEFIDKDDDWARLEVGSKSVLGDLGRAHPHGEWVNLDYGAG